MIHPPRKFSYIYVIVYLVQILLDFSPKHNNIATLFNIIKVYPQDIQLWEVIRVAGLYICKYYCVNPQVQ